MNTKLEALKNVGDVLALGAIAGSFMDFITPLAAVVGLVYAAVRLWETKTMQYWVAKIRGLPPPASSNSGD